MFLQWNRVILATVAGPSAHLLHFTLTISEIGKCGAKANFWSFKRRLIKPANAWRVFNQIHSRILALHKFGEKGVFIAALSRLHVSDPNTVYIFSLAVWIREFLRLLIVTAARCCYKKLCIMWVSLFTSRSGCVNNYRYFSDRRCWSKVSPWKKM